MRGWRNMIQEDLRQRFPDTEFTFVDAGIPSTGSTPHAFPFEGRAVGIFCVAGPQACVLEYSVDGAPFKRLDTFTDWSHRLYIPWVYMLETELAPARHILRLRVAKGGRAECQIRNFVVNK